MTLERSLYVMTGPTAAPEPTGGVPPGVKGAQGGGAAAIEVGSQPNF
jgi:hypothetical protein